VLCGVYRPEVALPDPNTTGTTSHAHPAPRPAAAPGQPATDLAGRRPSTIRSPAISCALATLGLYAVDEVKRRLGVPALRAAAGASRRPRGRIPARGFPPSRRMSKTCLPALVAPTWSQYVPGFSRNTSCSNLQYRALVPTGIVSRGQPVEQRSGLVILVRDEAVHRHRSVHTTLPTGLSSALGSPKISVS